MIKDTAILDSNPCCNPEKKLQQISNNGSFIPTAVYLLVKNIEHTHCGHQHLSNLQYVIPKCISYSLVWPLKYHLQLYEWKLQSRPQKAHGQTDSHLQTQHETSCRDYKNYCILIYSKNFHFLNKPNLVLNTFPN